MLCTKIVFCFDIQNNICTQQVVNLYFSLNSMNNISSYCGLTGARMRASEKDLHVHLPVQIPIKINNKILAPQQNNSGIWTKHVWANLLDYL